VSEKTSLTNVALSANCTVGEKARISNTVMMEGARVEAGAILQVRLKSILLSSVPDPNPDPPDPHVFGPPGSGSTSRRYGSGSGPSIIMQK
jgi:hypothetical protein